MAISIQRDIQQQLQAVNKGAAALIARETGANSEPIRLAATTLAREWRKLLNVPATDVRVSITSRRYRGKGSKPGQPPARLTGQTRKSIASAVVDGTRRVGSGWFKLRLLEEGVDAVVTPRRSAKGKRAGKRKIAVRGGAYALKIERRPSAALALERAMPAMEDVFVSTLQRKTAR